jgi:RNA polymerase sigma-70 factor (ECF subfamily)
MDTDRESREEADQQAHEAQLVLATRQGDTQAWDSLYERYAAWLYNFIAQRVYSWPGHPADDLFQETMLKAVAHLDRFDPTRGAFCAWLRGIATHEIRNAGRKRFRESRSVSGLAATSSAESTETPVDAALTRDTANERRRLVDLAFSELTPRHQLVLQWKYWQGRAPGEMAAQLGLDLAAVAALLYRARASFRVAYTKTCALESSHHA